MEYFPIYRNSGALKLPKNLTLSHAVQTKVKEFSTLDLRRTFASEMLVAGADIETVHKMMGYTNPDYTAQYVRQGVEAKRKAASLLHLPYAIRGMKDIRKDHTLGQVSTYNLEQVALVQA
jgi:integrase